MVNILTTNSILVNIDIISGSYVKKGSGVCRIETDGEGLYLGPKILNCTEWSLLDETRWAV